MPTLSSPLPRRGQAGFTLVELAVVVVIIGVLAAFAVPRFLASVERTKAAEAFNYLSTVHSSMERYSARQGTYASDLDDLDVYLENPQYFSVGTVAVPLSVSSLEEGWQVSLTRSGAASGFGAYTVTFDHEGFSPSESTITGEISPLATGS
ncbi:MAG: prepilin-type cleavage/methylation domain-containing protein [Planctomycetota bacterium]|nr:MAG: prepilin-type cleavage/methylation domain-containing protein [Planctomycetota bacterium]